MTVATKIAGAQQSWDSDAEFRADALAIHNALIATGGLIQTSDTGQTDFTTNIRSTNVAGGSGYTVYRFNDASQSSYPLFIRIDWFQSVITRPSLNYTIGTGTNGAGTITGVIRSITQISGGGAGNTSGTCDNYVSIGDGYLYVLLGIIAGSPGNQVSCMFFIERSTDEAGVVHPEEGISSFATPGNTRSYSIHPTGFSSIGPSSVGSPLNVGVNHQFWDDQSASDTGMMPVSYLMRSKLRFHRFAFMRTGRVGYGASFDATLLGATRKMISMEQNWFYNSSSSGWTNTSDCGALIIPWN